MYVWLKVYWHILYVIVGHHFSVQEQPFFHTRLEKAFLHGLCFVLMGCFFTWTKERAAATKGGSSLFCKLSLNAVAAALPFILAEMKSPNPELPQTVPLKVHILLAVQCMLTVEEGSLTLTWVKQYRNYFYLLLIMQKELVHVNVHDVFIMRL